MLPAGLDFWLNIYYNIKWVCSADCPISADINGWFIMRTEDKIEKYCKYCEKAKTLSDPEHMLCPKLGVVSAGHSCRKFRYDPLKRAPRLNMAKPTLEFVEI